MHYRPGRGIRPWASLDLVPVDSPLAADSPVKHARQPSRHENVDGERDCRRASRSPPGDARRHFGPYDAHWQRITGGQAGLVLEKKNGSWPRALDILGQRLSGSQSCVAFSGNLNLPASSHGCRTHRSESAPGPPGSRATQSTVTTTNANKPAVPKAAPAPG